MFNTPILFLIFNRPDKADKVFEAIRTVKPKYLYLAADGPRINKANEAEVCANTREIVLNSIDWDCEVKTLFREINLGCGKAVSEAITWFFDNVEEGIIIEDDCLPSLSFFSFCSQLLHYYRYDERIMMISGNNFQQGIKRGKGDYYFSAYLHIWGWASWRRAWEKYEFEPKVINERNIVSILRKYFNTKSEIDFWFSNFKAIQMKNVDTWDFQWAFSIWAANGLSILPNVNLVSNIGFGENASHTINESSIFSKVKTSSINTSLVHPRKIKQNRKADQYTSYKIIQLPRKTIKTQLLSIIERVMKLLALLIKKLLIKYIRLFKQS